ncbi:MAG: hypothetical protein GTO13_23215 [Proteobacteria bacterium]|nr:hypothetical protein [Pseudomonadota bacterium]NIS63488.1 hypothetical protein [Pseudomonadota bacterium]
MMRYLLIGIMAGLLILPAWAFADGDSISAFKAESLYRAVALDWKVRTPFTQEVVFQILRSDSFPEGPYEEVATVPYDKRKRKYKYLDKSIGAESNYYYKLIVKGTDETHGPVQARPFFSPPAT